MFSWKPVTPLGRPHDRIDAPKTIGTKGCSSLKRDLSPERMAHERA